METKTAYIVRIVLALAAMLGPAAGAAQRPRDVYIVSEIDHQQSLSHSSVLCIFKDRDELMWFGTYDGINCFDGSEMDVYRTDFSKPVSLDNNVISRISQADGDHLWIYSQVGLNRFSCDERAVVANYALQPGAHLASNLRGNSYLVMQDSVAYFNPRRGEFVGLRRLDVPVGDTEQRSFVTTDGELWLFPEAGEQCDLTKIALDRFDAGAEEQARAGVVSVRFHHHPVEQIFYQDDRSFCFVDSEKDLYIYDVWRQTKVYIRNIASLLGQYGIIVGIVPFYEDFMIAFRSNGLVQLRATESYREEIIDRNLRIFCLYQDPAQGILWIGVDGRGVMMYTKRHSIATNLMTPHLSPNFTRQVRSILADDRGDLWFGTKGDGLIRIADYASGMTADKARVYTRDRVQPVGTYTREDVEFAVYSLRPSRYMDGFWVGTGAEGLFYRLSGEDRLRHLDLPDAAGFEEIHEVYEADDSTLYAATRNGFDRLTIDRSGGRIAVKARRHYRFFHKQEEINTFYSMLPEGDSMLWLGSRGRGLVRFELRSESYWVYSLGELLEKPIDDVLCLHRAGDGDLLAGTTAGLVRLHFEGKKATASYVGREQGLLNDMIHGILEDDEGFLWLSTNKGLVRYNPASGSLHSYYYSSGVQIGEFSDDAYYKCPATGRLFFGGMNGLLYVDRTDAEEHGYYPDILLRRISLNGRPVDPAEYRTADGQGLRLRHTDGELTLTFAVPDFVSGSDIEYAWMLEGHDAEWSPFSPQREVSYAGLPAGSYTLHVRYRKAIFDTEYRSCSIPIRILPLWWQTLLFRLLAVAATVVAVGCTAWTAVRLKRHKRLLAKLLKSESDHAPEGGTGAPGRDVVACLTAIWRECDALRGDATADALGRTADRIRESVLSLLPPAELLSHGDAISPPLAFFSQAWSAAPRSISDEVMFPLMKRGVDLGNVEVEIPKELRFPVYRNALRILFCYVYLFVAGGKRVTVAASESDGMMTLTFRTPSRSLLRRLHESLRAAEAETAPAQKGADAAFELALLRHFVEAMMRQLRPVVAYSQSEQELSFSFLPAPERRPEAGRKTVLVLEDRDEMFWYVECILAEEYAVRQVRSIQQAVEAMEGLRPAALVVDMAMYAGAEAPFAEFIDGNRALLARTAFVLLLARNVRTDVQRRLIAKADSFAMLPQEVVFLREIVDKAIAGRSDARQIPLDGITGSMAGMVTCTTREQAEFIRRVAAIIEEHIDHENLGSTFIADRLAMSPRKFYRLFKEISDCSPAEFIKNYRLEKAAALLVDGMAVKEVMAEIGITSRSYLYREFAAKYGMTPSAYRNREGRTEADCSRPEGGGNDDWAAERGEEDAE